MVLIRTEGGLQMIYKILIADDEPPFIRSLKRMLNKYATNFQVIGEAFNGLDAFEKVSKLRPDIVFTDIKLIFALILIRVFLWSILMECWFPLNNNLGLTIAVSFMEMEFLKR